MRITQVVVTDAFAGTERYVVDVSAELARRGHDVHVVGGEPHAMRRLLPGEVVWRPGASAPEALRALAHGGRRQVVHGHTAKADFVAAMAAPLTGGVRVSTRHITARRGFSPTAARLARVVRAGMRREIAVSRWVADQVESRVDDVLLNGVHTVPDVTGPRSRTVLVAQRLAAEKDTALALDAFGASGLGEAGWRLHVAGDGPLRRDLEDRARTLAGVRLLGWVDDLPALLETAGLLLAPAPGEPCGLTVLEAMAAGLPVVAAAGGGHRETVGAAPSAAVFRPGDAVAAAEQLQRLAGDAAARTAYGEELRALQRSRFTLAGHVDALERIYAEARR